MSSIEEDLKEEIIETKTEHSDLRQMSELLLNDQFKRRKTRLRERTVSALTTLDTIAQLYDVEWLLNWVEGFTEYVTSVNGQGRQEIVDITKFSIDKETQRNQEILKMLGNR